MSQVAAGMGHEGANPSAMSHDNISLREGGGAGLSNVLIGAGVAAVAATLAAGFMMDGALKQALAAYHIGAMASLAVCLGALFFVMAFHLTMAGWSVTIRRQFENVMVLAPVAGVLVLAGIVVDLYTGGHLFSWMNKDLRQGDVLYEHKAVWLNPIRLLIFGTGYVLAWFLISWRLWWYSTEQDRTGDRWLSNRARFTSSWGMPVFALTTAFAAFDWLMSVDYRFFSTMWGVYYFAGAAFSSVPVVVIMLALLRRAGKLEGAVTEEHCHDLGKLMFAFTVFWAYISFSQYFLIWYSNIPEETSFMLARKTDGWNGLSTFLAVGHFIVPWYILLWRFMRRSWGLLSVMAAWAILVHVMDIYWVVRPMVYAGQADPIRLGMAWLDVLGIVGVPLIVAGLVVRKVYSGVLVPVKDPRLPEALSHCNYV
jgi:hypothetical protein